MSFWGNKITQAAQFELTDLSDHLDKTIVNLASNEYFKAIDRECPERAMLYPPNSLTLRDGQAKSLMYYAKVC